MGQSEYEASDRLALERLQEMFHPIRGNRALLTAFRMSTSGLIDRPQEADEQPEPEVFEQPPPTPRHKPISTYCERWMIAHHPSLTLPEHDYLIRIADALCVRLKSNAGTRVNPGYILRLSACLCLRRRDRIRTLDLIRPPSRRIREIGRKVVERENTSWNEEYGRPGYPTLAVARVMELQLKRRRTRKARPWVRPTG